MMPEDADLCTNVDALGQQCTLRSGHEGKHNRASGNAPKTRWNLLARIEQQEAEIDLLRRVVRAADYWVVAGQSAQYDEAREALTEFDRDRQAGSK
jgi:hypothetical protein